MEKGISQFRQDLVSGNWVLIATVRAKRPHAFRAKTPPHDDSMSTCPFEDPQASGNGAPLLLYAPQDNPQAWTLQVIPNKFKYMDAPLAGVCPEPYPVDGNYAMEGRGFNEILITRAHATHFSDLSPEEMVEVIRAYQERYAALKEEACVKYISIFHNFGPEAGASISHPHSQILAVPVIPPDVHKSYEGSRRYYETYRECVHCVLVRNEMHEKVRIFYENEAFIVVCPYASRMPFETVITPVSHQARFEEIDDATRRHFADALRAALRKLKEGLGNPQYNFFIHTSPAKDLNPDYHWHLELVPKTSVWAGFEIATGIEITTISPEDAAAYLREVAL